MSVKFSALKLSVSWLKQHQVNRASMSEESKYITIDPPCRVHGVHRHAHSACMFSYFPGKWLSQDALFSQMITQE